MKALITGISGFVGSHLAECLLEATDWQVAGTVFGPEENIEGLRARLELYPADLSQPETVTSILRQARPDAVWHLAAQPLVSESQHDPWGTLATNIRVQLNLLEAVRRVVPDCRVVVVGSSEEYGLVRSEELPVDEETPLRPLSPYALSKVTQDLMGLQYYLAHQLRVVRVRPFNHIGARQRAGYVAPDLASQIAAAERGDRPAVIQVGNLDVRRDFSDVRDVVRAYALLATGGEPGEVYNVGSGHSHSIREMLEIFLSLSRVPIEVRQDKGLMRPADVPELVCDATRLRDCTGWQPRIPFEQSLKDVLDYWRR